MILLGIITGGIPIIEERSRKNFVKKICTLVIVSILSGSCCLAAAQSFKTTRHQNQPQPLASAGLSDPPSGYELLLQENFSDGNMPPTGAWGDWDRKQTNANQTWYLDSTYPYTDPYCGTVHRDGSLSLQDEWLITPSLNLSTYTNTYLKFHWYTCYYVTMYKRYVEFNISVSTDGGGNWTRVWSFDDVNVFFTDWTWQDSIIPNNDPIDLSAYAGQNDVLIAFQFYSNKTLSADEQEFSIDDIEVYAPGVQLLKCNAGGPYEWWWSMQYEYIVNPGVRFHGSLENGTVFTKWLWDFGDGNTSTIPYYPIHFYNDIGTYNISLTVIDNSTTPPRIAFDYTTINLFLLKPPEIDIEAQPFSLGIKATINNGGEYNATYVNWTIRIAWGPFQIFQIFEKNVGNGTLEKILAGSSASIRSRYYFFGFGLLNIVFTVYPENIPGIIAHYRALKIGPFALVFPKA